MRHSNVYNANIKLNKTRNKKIIKNCIPMVSHQCKYLARQENVASVTEARRLWQPEVVPKRYHCHTFTRFHKYSSLFSAVIVSSYSFLPTEDVYCGIVICRYSFLSYWYISIFIENLNSLRSKSR